MVNSAILSKKDGLLAENPKPKKMFNIDAYIPSNYAINSDKIQLYQELDNCKSEDEISAFCARIRDIYGPIPHEMQLLIKKKSIDMLVENDEFDSLLNEENEVMIILNQKWSEISGIGVEFFQAILPYIDDIKGSKNGKNFYVVLTKKEDWLNELYEILKIIHSLTLEHTNKEV